MDRRAEEIFGTLHVNSSFDGYPVCRRPASDATRAQFCLACPSTYQLEGGLSVALPAGLQRAVLHHVVAQITGDEKGNYTGFSGYTSIPGRGWWYSENACQEVEKRVEWVMVHAKIDRVAVASLAPTCSGHGSRTWSS